MPDEGHRTELTRLLPLRPSRELIATLAVAFVIAVAHAVATWGHVTVYWGDLGFILDLLARAESGQVVYRDFHWPYLPFSLWVMAGLTNVVGSDVVGMWIASMIVYAALVAVFVRYVWLVAPAGTRVMVTAVGLLLSVALANLGGSPLPLGTYSPPGPVGFLMLFLAWCAALGFVQTKKMAWAVVASSAGGLAVLSKHDFWFGAAFIVIACLWQMRHTDNRWRKAAIVGLPAVAVVLVGWGIVAATTDVGMVIDMLGGFGYVDQQAHRGAPTLEILTIQAMMLGALATLALGASELAKDRGARRWRRVFVGVAIVVAAAGIWMAQAYRIAGEVAVSGVPATPTPLETALSNASGSLRAFAVSSVRTFVDHSARHAIPILVPCFVLVAIALGWPRRLPNAQRGWLGLLIAFGLMLRARRLFEFTEWFVVLVEIPAYAAVIMAWTPPDWRRRFLPARAIFTGFALFGVVAYYQYGRGPLTRRGRHPRTGTAQGAIRSGTDTASVTRVIQALNKVDPSGKRPLFSYGYTNGFNYFTGRPYPRATPIGFRSTSRMRPDSTVRGVLESQPPALVIDGPFWDDMRFPVRNLSWFSWERRFERPTHVMQMRLDFQPIHKRCPQVARLGSGPRAFTVLDCAAQPVALR